MAKQRPRLQPGASEADIQKVLDAEAGALSRIERAEAEAGRLRAQARETLRRLETRTDERLQRVHEACRRRLADALRRLDRERREATRKACEIPDEDEWREAVDRVARRLLGLSDEDSGA